MDSLQPTMTVNGYLEAAGIKNGTAKRRKGTMVAQLLEQVPARDRKSVQCNTWQVASTWQWPLTSLAEAHAAVELAEAVAGEERPEADPSGEADDDPLGDAKAEVEALHDLLAIDLATLGDDVDDLAPMDGEQQRDAALHIARLSDALGRIALTQ
jgi:hypothetical protein